MVAIVCSKDVGEAAAQSYLKRAPAPTSSPHAGKQSLSMELSESEKRGFSLLKKVGQAAIGAL